MKHGVYLNAIFYE